MKYLAITASAGLAALALAGASFGAQAVRAVASAQPARVCLGPARLGLQRGRLTVGFARDACAQGSAESEPSVFTPISAETLSRLPRRTSGI